MFLKWINQGHPDNQYIIVTNHIIPRKSTRKQQLKNWWFKTNTFEWNVNTYGASSGIARRLGLCGTVRTELNDTALMGTEATTIEMNQRGHYILNGEPLTEREVLDFSYRTFQANVINGNEVIQVNETFNEHVEFDSVVTCENMQALRTVFSSKKKIIQSCFKRCNGASIKFTSALFSKAIQSFDDAKELMPGAINDDVDLVANALTIATLLNDIMPGLSCKLYIEDIRREIVLNDRKLYIGVLEDYGLNIRHDPVERRVFYHWQNKIESFTYEQYNMFVARGHPSSGLHTIPPECVAQIHDYIKQNIGDTDPLFNYHKMKADIAKLYADYQAKTITDFIADHKALSIVIGLVGIVTVTSITALFIKFFSNKDQEDENKNIKSNAKGGSTGDDEYCNENIREHVTKYRREMMKGNHELAKEIRQQAYNEGHREAWNRWEDEFRSNSLDVRTEFNKALATADIERLNFLINTYGAELEESLKNSKVNNITIDEEIHQQKSLLECLSSKIQRNAVLVTGRGKVYGIGLFGKILVTVSHIFPDKDSPVTVQSNGVVYEARVARLSRQRDLAMVIELVS